MKSRECFKRRYGNELMKSRDDCSKVWDCHNEI